MKTSTDSFVSVQLGRQDLDTQKIKARSDATRYGQLQPLKVMRFIYMLKYAECLRTRRVEEPHDGEADSETAVLSFFAESQTKEPLLSKQTAATYLSEFDFNPAV